MKEYIYKNLSIALLLTNVWSVISFLIFYFEEAGFMQGFETAVFFLKSCWTAGVIGTLLLVVRRVFFKKHTYKVLVNSLCVIAGAVNFFFFVVFIVLSALGLLKFMTFFTLFILLNLLIAVICWFELIKKKSSSIY